MLLFLEILLTVSAWRKGWGPMALLPLAIGVPLGLLLMANTGSMLVGFLGDVVITAVLYEMTRRGRTAQPVAQPAPAPAAEVTRQNAA
jgi:hypothetical protein